MAAQFCSRIVCTLLILFIWESFLSAQCSVSTHIYNDLCHIGDSVNVTLTPSGGTGPYTYSWDNGATTQTVTVELSTHDEYYTVTDAAGCSYSDFVHVPNAFPYITFLANYMGCNLALIKLQWSIDLPLGMTYLWSTGATTPTITLAPPSSYSLTLTDPSSGCTLPLASALTLYAPQIDVTSITSANCGQNNGAIDVTLIGGASPLSYTWSNGVHSEDLNNIPGGTYTLTVTGATGCTSTASVVVPGSGTPLNINGSTMPNSSCTGNNGSINITVAPAGAYTFTWSNGANTEDLSGLASGPYAVTVSNPVNGCTSTTSFTVVESPNPPSATATTLPASCSQSNGSVNLTVSGGTLPYIFDWSNGAATEDLQNVAPGNYSVTVTATNGCTATAIANISNNNGLVSISGNAAPNSSCLSGNGAIDITPLPAGNYNFSWSNGTNVEDLSGLNAGLYTVTATNGSCSSTVSFIVANNQAHPVATTTILPASCGQNNGSVDLTLTAGVAPFAFNWSNGAGTEDLQNLASGNYSVTITGDDGCTATTAATVASDNGTVNIIGNTLANSGCTANNGAINITVSPTDAYTFNWSNGSTTEDLSNLPAGQYTVTASTGSGCSSTANFTITNNQSLPNASTTVVATSCGQANGSVNLTVSGGANPLIFNWSSGATTEDLTNVAAGAYTVTVTGANGCSAIADALVAGSNAISLAGNASANTSCLVGNGAIDVTPSPTGAYTFAWSNGATAEDVADLTAGLYMVTVTSSAGCSSTDSFTVANNPTLPAPTALALPSTCGQANGSVDLSVGGGNLSYTFNWSSGATTEDLANVAAGSYTVTVTGNNGCTALANAVVANDNVVIAIDGSVSANTSCTPGNGAINITAAPTGSYSFNWSNGATTEDLTAVSSGSYTVTVSAGGSCTSTASFSVVSNSNPPVATLTVVPAICGQSNGSVDLTVGSGAFPYTFNWSNGTTTEDLQGLSADIYTVTVSDAAGCSTTTVVTVTTSFPAPVAINGPANGCAGSDVSLQATAGFSSYAWSSGQNTPAILVSQPGNYAVTATDVNGCTVTSTHTFATFQPTVADISGPASVCTGSSATLTVIGNFPQISWSTGALGSSITVSQSGAYQVTVTDTNGCTATAEHSVQVGGSLVPNLTTAVSCDLTASLDAGTGYVQYLWSTGATSQAITVDMPGNYSVTVSDGNGCSGSVSSNIVIPAPPQVSISGPSSICTGNNAVLSITGSFAQIMWSSGATSPTISVSQPDNYTVTVTDANGCTATSIHSLTVGSSLSPDIVTAVGCTGSATLDAGSSYATYLWSTGANSASTIVNATGNYFVTVSDAGGCTGTATIAVTIPSPPQVAVSGPANACAGASVSLSADAGFASYLWSNGQNTVDIVVTASATYTVTVTDTNGCTAVAEHVFVFSPAPTLIISGPVSICTGTSAVLNVANNFAQILWSTGATTASIPVSQAGTYAVTVTDANGCTAETEQALTVGNSLVTNVNAAIPPCAGTAVLDAGTGFTTYLWSTGASSQTIQTGLNGTYSVTVSNGNGCTGSGTVAVVIPVLPQVAINGPVSACTGSNVVLTTGTGYSSYNWSTGETSANITVNQTGTYAVIVTDANGCTASDQTTLSFSSTVQTLLEKSSCFAQDTGIVQLLLNTQTGCDSLVITHTSLALPPDIPPVAVSNFHGFAVSCDGSSDGSATATAQGGTAPYIFQWSNNTTGSSVQNLSAGAYTVTVTDVNGCSDNTSLVLSAPPPILGAFTQQEVQCFTPGQIVVEAIKGGTGPYNIAAVGQNFSTNGLDEVVLTDVSPGSYAILITDANGCSTTESVSLTAPSGNTVQTFTNTFLVQSGDTVQLQAPAGFANVSISWSPTTGLSCTHCADPWLIATEEQIYTGVLQGFGDCRIEGVNEIKLRSIDEKTPFYVPNVILPGSANNGLFTIYAGEDLINIRVLRIFDRWGEVVTEIENFPPNGPTGWEGDFDGNPVNPGVYVFYAWLEFADGSTQLVKGDVTVVR